MANNSKLDIDIDLLTDNYEIYNNSVDNFEIEFGSYRNKDSAKNVENITIEENRIELTKQTKCTNCILGAKIAVDEIIMFFAHTYKNLINELFINKLRSINCDLIKKDDLMIEPREYENIHIHVKNSATLIETTFPLKLVYKTINKNTQLRTTFILYFFDIKCTYDTKKQKINIEKINIDPLEKFLSKSLPFRKKIIKNIKCDENNLFKGKISKIDPIIQLYKKQKQKIQETLLKANFIYKCSDCINGITTIYFGNEIIPLNNSNIQQQKNKGVIGNNKIGLIRNENEYHIFKLDSELIQKFIDDPQKQKSTLGDILYYYILNYIYYKYQIFKYCEKTKPMNYILPVKKIIKIKDNVMIISYNEEAKKFNESDLYTLLEYIKKMAPSIIIVNTQESASRIGDRGTYVGWKDVQHFQHIFRESIEKDNYYEMVDKSDASLMKGYIKETNKNVRMRIYKRVENNNINIINKKKMEQSTKSGFGKLLKFTVWKGSIMCELTLKKKKSLKLQKFIFVNSHLFFDSHNYKKGSGIKTRIKMFMDLIEEFKLYDKYNEGYNIFFLGDLNFRLTKLTNTNKHLYNSNKNDDGKKEYIVSIVKDHLINMKNNKNNKNKLYEKDEIYEFLEKEINKLTNDNDNESKTESNKLLSNQNNINKSYKKKILLDEFKKSIEESRTFLSFKYKNNINLNELYNDKSTNNSINSLTYDDIKKYFKTEDKTRLKKVTSAMTPTFFGSNTEKLDDIIKPPSNPDRIVYALQKDIKIKKDDLKMFLEPRKSDHKMITLNVDL